MKKALSIGSGLVLAAAILVGAASRGQSATPVPVKVDPKHYKVVFENERVRVLRITYGPEEKSVTHYHPDGVVVYLTGAITRMVCNRERATARRMQSATSSTHAPPVHDPAKRRLSQSPAAPGACRGDAWPAVSGH